MSYSSTRILKRCTLLAEKLERVLVINGDGTDKDLLREENVEDVDLVVAITGDEEVIIPRGDSIVRPKDRLIIFALQQIIPKLEKLFTVNPNVA